MCIGHNNIYYDDDDDDTSLNFNTCYYNISYQRLKQYVNNVHCVLYAYYTMMMRVQ